MSQNEWDERILGRVEQLGCSSFEGYLDGRQGVSYATLAAELGDVLPVMVEDLQMRRAAQQGDAVRQRAAMDSLVRTVREVLTGGWNQTAPPQPGVEASFMNIVAASTWTSTVRRAGIAEEQADAVWNAIRRRATDGWLPNSVDDEIVRGAFDEAWPLDKRSNFDSGSRETPGVKQTSTHSGEKLIEELLADPAPFYETGRGYDLLQEYFHGLPLDTLRPLLRSSDYAVQRVATFILTELGNRAAEVVEDALPLLAFRDRTLSHDVLEAIAVCSGPAHPDWLIHLAHTLESDDDVLVKLAMFLLSQISTAELAAARDAATTSAHREGLGALASGRVDASAARAMLGDANPLVRRYGAIAAKRLKDPELLAELAKSEDPVLRAL